MKANYDRCKIGKHNLIKIFTSNTSDGIAVVRWCKECGAVVVDNDYDNRTQAGYHRKLEYPNIAHDHVKEIMS